MRLLVTDGARFIGSHFADPLVDLGADAAVGDSHALRLTVDSLATLRPESQEPARG
jgi:nucleoside-diphosphate-sugar epimerase